MSSGRRWLGNSTAYAVVVESLMSAAYTISELVAVSGLAETTTWKFVKALHRRRVAHIAVWRTDRRGRFSKPAYKLGAREDARRPPPRTSAQRSAKRRRMLALQAMTRDHDEPTSVAPRRDAESKSVEDDAREPSA